MTKINANNNSSVACALLLLLWLLSNLGLHVYLLFVFYLFLLYISSDLKVYLGSEYKVLIITTLILITGWYRVPKESIHEIAYIGSFLYCLSGVFAIRAYFGFSSFIRERALFYLCVFFAVIIVLQQFIYIIFKNYIDLHSYITLFSYEARYQNNFHLLYPLIRPTAFFQEPSNFSIVLTTLAFLSKVESNNRLFKCFLFLSMCTLSFAAFFIAIVLLSYQYFSKIKQFKKYSIYLIIIITPIIVPFLLNQLETLDFGYNAVGYRLQVFELLSKISSYEFLFGLGLFFIEHPISIYELTMNSSHFKDSGFIVNILISFGLFGVVGFFLWLYSCMKNKELIILILLTLFLKFDFNMPALWVVIFTISFYSKAIMQNEKS
ncbi:hypothetical protein I6F53_11065 [Pseudoalteromonas sp. SWN29]|uniref:hypothetical protein n=1 Tax=Pseudoalteromonas sp. SWN29 TaxID=2792064 RepID=UPI0018CE94E2|nr:hypothetical protein [Pseudoalteromonas sp. SWN29]MBH0027524.1 hypothetical protein [Pseudoalteromonas sp. SWN29]